MTGRFYLWQWVVWAAASATLAAAAEPADTIYHGGDIVTINEQQPTAEALVVSR